MKKILHSGLFLLLVESHALALVVPHAAVQAQLSQATLVADIRVEALHHSPHPSYFATFEADARILQKKKETDDGGWFPSEGESIQLEGVGGELGDRGVYFSGLPRPRVNQEYTAYLIRAGDRSFRIAGFEYGLVPRHPNRQFSRNRTDGSNGEGNGAFLYWEQSYMPVPYFISAPSFRGLAGFAGAIDNSFETWRDVPDIKVEFLAMGCSESVRNENDGINTVIMINQGWPFDPSAIAITRNFYLSDSSPRPGMILDTDILLNGEDHEFSTTGDPTKYDLQDILTHEAGHFLGLGHEVSPVDSSATMYAIADPGETNKRTLHTDDLLGIRSAYPGVGNKLGPLHSDCAIADAAPSCLAIHGDDELRPLSAWYLVGSLAYLVSMILGGRLARPWLE